MTATSESSKSIHTILLDAGPILLNTPSISTLTAQSQVLVTTSAVVAEIKGEEARLRFDTLYRPFISIRQAKPESIKHVREFARKTGDLPVLSATDIEVIALAYDLEVDRNGGDWRLRNVPGQKRVNGKRPDTSEQTDQSADGEADATISEVQKSVQAPEKTTEPPQTRKVWGITHTIQSITLNEPEQNSTSLNDISVSEGQTPFQPVQAPTSGISPSDAVDEATLEAEQESESESEGGEWITPSNLKKHQSSHSTSQPTSTSAEKHIQVATISSDFAIQNILLQMNLNLLSPTTCSRITNLRSTILRCHACFATTRDLSRYGQFCARCGGANTLTRVTCTTNSAGETKLHLKKGFQWNNRGNVYSIPKPQGGSANGKFSGAKQKAGQGGGGGKNGWGSGLVLAEDQKEYVRAMSEGKRKEGKSGDLMDQDVMPGIFSGSREGTGRSGGRVKVGAGRNVNGKKR